MTGIAKLYAWILANPRASVSFREFERLVLATGFVLDRITGSHHQYRHPLVPQVLSIQPRGKDAKSYQVVQFVAMVQQYNLTVGDA